MSSERPMSKARFMVLLVRESLSLRDVTRGMPSISLRRTLSRKNPKILGTKLYRMPLASHCSMVERSVSGGMEGLAMSSSCIL